MHARAIPMAWGDPCEGVCGHGHADTHSIQTARRKREWLDRFHIMHTYTHSFRLSGCFGSAELRYPPEFFFTFCACSLCIPSHPKQPHCSPPSHTRVVQLCTRVCARTGLQPLPCPFSKFVSHRLLGRFATMIGACVCLRIWVGGVDVDVTGSVSMYVCK